jgi:hypothetical protein
MSIIAAYSAFSSALSNDGFASHASISAMRFQGWCVLIALANHPAQQCGIGTQIFGNVLFFESQDTGRR